MEIAFNIDNFSAVNSVVTVGTFDGLHLGHQEILHTLITEANNISGESVVFTFAQHPRMVLGAENSNLKLLSTNEEKIKLFEKFGINNLILYSFTKEFSQLTSEEFIRDFLVKKMNVRTLVVGYDHHFGKNREGEMQQLAKLSDIYNFTVINVNPFQVDGLNVSSTKIRNFLNDGNIDFANQLLGYEYNLSGIVVEGKKLGRQIGFPTANIVVSNILKQIPANGVYAIKLQIKDSIYNAMLNIGSRPTVNADIFDVTIEANIFDFNQDIYNEHVTIFFKSRIRNEIKFQNIDDLKLQLSLDKQTVLRLLS